jgi:peptide/nickel transport system permease protein
MRQIKPCLALGTGAVLLLLFAAFSLFPAQIAPYGVKEMFPAFLPPSKTHFLGTNDMGYDIFTELVQAAGATLAVGIIAAAASLVTGTAIGLLAGYLPGAPGEAAGGFINVFLLIPMLPAAIVAAAFLGAGILKIALVIALLGWCPTARVVRARTAQLKQTGFVESLVILQIPKTKILAGHILPNLSEIIRARFILSVSNCMMTEAALSFIGLGDPSRVTWGGMVNLAYRNGGFARGALNWFFAPGLCITLCSLAFMLIGRFLECRAESVRGGGNRSYLE